MAGFNDLPSKAQFGIIFGVAIAVTVALYLLMFQGMSEANATASAQLESKRNEIAKLREYEPRLAELNSQIELLKRQLEIQKQIVPDAKEADRFMHLMQETATAAGVNIRRYTARPVATREFYAEVPFEIDLDGPYFGVLDFFQRIAKLERIINISNLQMAAVAQGGVVRRRYPYVAGQTVVASCVATTFFSSDLAGTPAK
jgi:type IV pilus assembly protein PilO